MPSCTSRSIQHPTTIWLATLFIALATLTPLASAGDLNPPAGPIQPTGPVLFNNQSISLPFTISQPGTYILTSGFQGIAVSNGITISSSNVTLDLGGYEIIGVPGSLSGITSFGTVENIEIRNGIVRSWAGNGIDIAQAKNSRIIGVRAFNNTGIGILVGPGSHIKDCVATMNQNDGFFAGNGSIVTDCTAYLNFDDGFTSNPGVTFRGTSSSLNNSAGYRVLSGCTFLGCAAFQNANSGFVTAEANSLTSCTAQFNGSNGFNTGVDCKIEGCVSYDNALNGFNSDNEALIIHCIASRNQADGILVQRDSYVFGNLCDNNGFSATMASGIHAMFEGNRIDSNNCTDNDMGIEVDRAGNIIVRNSASKSQVFLNFVIVPGNDVGPIGSAATATSPWANFEF